jgi:hypothetical protein
MSNNNINQSKKINNPKIELYNENINTNLTYFKEPNLMFGYNQKTEDPRDGLILWGPYDRDKANNFNIGIIGEPEGIVRLNRWLEKIRKPMQSIDNDIARPFFPGFESTFEVGINFGSIQKIEIEPKAIDTYLKYTDKHQRVKHLVDLFTEELIKYKNEEEHINIQVWFIIIPDKVYLYGRPKSVIPVSPENIKDSLKKRERHESFLFDEYNKLQEAYNYEPHFHNQLKARLLKHKIITQIIKESTIAYEEVSHLPQFRLDGIRKMDTDKAWNISTTLYYKACGRPWKLGDIREKVCYVGLVFKKDEKNVNPKFACCAAQMFLDSGDGMVFKGDVGPWYSPDNNQFHLDKDSAKKLLQKALQTYYNKNDDTYPDEIFIHGKTYFDDNEWAGFTDASEGKSKVIGIRIRDDKLFKIYREYNYPVLRGLTYIIDNNSALLWTRGFVSRLQTIIGTETPNALSIEIARGEADIETVCRDILALTKLNYNACIFSDGIPVTLRFADMIGEILTAAPLIDEEILPFQYYI